MSIIKAIAEAAREDVEIGALVWRIRAVEPYDLLEHGQPGLMIMKEVLDPGGKDKPAKDFDMLRMSKAQREKGRKAQKAFDALVCAAVTHVRASDEDDFTPIKLVPREPMANEDDGILWIGTLPPGTAQILMGRVFNLSVPAEAAERLATFRGRPNADSDAA